MSQGPSKIGVTKTWNSWNTSMFVHQFALADPRGAPGTRAPPWGSKFFHFHAVFGKKLKNNSTFGSWRPPPGENPGSATDL